MGNSVPVTGNICHPLIRAQFSRFRDDRYITVEFEGQVYKGPYGPFREYVENKYWNRRIQPEIKSNYTMQENQVIFENGEIIKLTSQNTEDVSLWKELMFKGYKGPIGPVI